MNEYRKISKIIKSKPTMEGAGVRLKRAFGYHEVPLLDPFLLLDDFHSDNPDDYMAGFPWHPHRGIETVTYMHHGKVKHEDSLGNGGVIEPGDVQWMTAGSGIVHSEMPQMPPKGETLLRGFQLWVNLPKTHKMMDPRYQEVKQEQIPEISLDNGVKIKIICGEVQGSKGPVRDIVVDSQYLDVTVPAHAVFEYSITSGYTGFAYVITGSGYFDEDKSKQINQDHLVIFDDGDRVKISTDDVSVCFLLVSGEPIKEPVAWHGPIVMNTQEELRIAFEEYQKGTFIKKKGDGG
ncbi:MAG: pirin family protein [Candidatus Aminicenantes bacterium]|nr:MAG: pirin family protein [Candidatus Aminicenantes bacterium]